MLKYRVITALILFAIVLGALFGLERTGFALVAGVFFLAAGWEWSGMMGKLGLPLRVLWVLVLAGLLVASEYDRPSWMPWLALWWLPALWMVMTYPGTAKWWSRSGLMAVFGLLLLVPAFSAAVTLKSNGAFGLAGPFALLFVLLWVFAADTGAYFAGRAFGKRKLALQVSPGKTWEGLIGGLLLALLVTLVAAWLTPISTVGWQLFAVAVLVVLSSVLGDLFESMIKRKVGIKDSGSMLPGHGGMLDRMDSITAALPVAVLLIVWLGLS